ncbi:MAG: hypothetical protein JRD94_07220 [Deltaproteobacteria bacterium]|nr:hypothetical protein [Deltaproteobacteria bacterium]
MSAKLAPNLKDSFERIHRRPLDPGWAASLEGERYQNTEPPFIGIVRTPRSRPRSTRVTTCGNSMEEARFGRQQRHSSSVTTEISVEEPA